MNNRDQFTFGEQMNKLQDSSTTSQQAKQIAMIKWLLVKADKNLEDYRDIFQPVPNAMIMGKNSNCRLHPKIVNALQSAELYSAALVNMHVDHHFYNPDHNRILQVLARKGVILSDPQLTVSVLLKSDPINLIAHLSVIEAIMILYAKEVASPDRIFAAIEKFVSPQRFPNDVNSNAVIHQRNITDYDQLLLLWIAEAVSALNKRIKQELSSSQENEANVLEDEISKGNYFRIGKELTDLSDGIALCALVSFYCPQSLPWKKIRVGKPINTADCLHNLTLFIGACQTCLPYPVFHMNPQDMLSHSISSMRPVVITLLADLFNLFEISPRVLSDNRSDTSSYSNSEFQAVTTPSEQAIPNLRNYSTVPNGGHSESRTANSSPKPDRKYKSSVSDNLSTSEFFVVHRGRNIPTLSSVNPDNGLKEKYEPIAAGKPTNWNDTRKTQMSGCGRRSRRNSFSEDSQLTIENFGGSHENLNLIGRNPDKEFAVHVVSQLTENPADHNDVGRQHRIHIAAEENRSSAGVTSLLCDNTVSNAAPVKPYRNSIAESTTAVAIFPPGPLISSGPSIETSEILESCKVSSQMLNIRLKLEEKRRQIEMEKRRMELNLKKQRQKLNKAAFLQAVSKMDLENVNGGSSDGGGCNKGQSGDGNDDNNSSDPSDIDHDSIVTYEDISQVEQRWLKDGTMVDRNVNGDLSPSADGPISDSDNIDIEKCQKSISEMDSSLHAIQTDLQWLALKESEILHNPVSESQNADLTKLYPVSFMLNQETQQASSQNQLLHRMMINNQQNQNNDFYSNSVDYNTNETRENFNIPNKNLCEFNYNDSCVAYTQHSNLHHHSLISPVPMKSPLPASNPQVMKTFDHVNCTPDNVYMYQQQLSPMLLHSHISPNFSCNNYRSMNIQNPCVSEDKENQVQVHQTRKEQFYLHKPTESTPFSFQSPPAAVANLNYSTSPSSGTTFSQRKTWDSQNNTANVPSQPTPPPRLYTSRFLLNKDPVTLTKTFTDNKLKCASPTTKFSDEHNASPCFDNSVMYPLTLSSTKKNYSPVHKNSGDLNHTSQFNVSETDAIHRQPSVGSVSIPTPSPDDMAPQCISFIGSQSDNLNVNKDTVDKISREDHLCDSVNKLNIINGNRTYRIPSPTNKSNFRPSSNHPFISDNDTNKNEKGFYVSFSNDDDNENDNAKRFSERMKAPLRMKRALNSSNSVSSTRNDKFKNNVKLKSEINKKPETIFNERSHVMENHSEQKSTEMNDVCNRILEKAGEDTIVIKTKKNGSASNSSVGLLINADVNSNDPAMVDEMERKKERILLQSLQRRQQQEEMKARKEIELQRRKEQEKQKEDLKAMKKEEEKRRRAAILEKHRLKKMIEEAEREGKPIDKELLNALNKTKSNSLNGDSGRSNSALPKLRAKKQPFATRPRPKTIHIDVGSNLKEGTVESNLLTSNFSKKGSTVNLTEHSNNNYGMSRRDYYRGSQDCLLTGAEMGNTAGTSASSIYSDLTDEDRAVSATYPVKGSNCGSIGRRRGSSYKTSRDVSLDRATSRIARPKFSSYYQSYPRKSSSLMNLCGSSCDQDSLTYNSRYMTDTDSGLGLVTPPHRTSSPAPNNSSPSGPGSLPPSHHCRRRYDDTASESGGSEYGGLRLYKQPAVKSNRGIIMNAIEYCVFPGEVNRGKKNRLIEEITRSDGTSTKHFLILFRDAGCQYRALYSYFPETEEVIKVSGIGPRLVTEDMFDKFFKYNSGGKCFTQVHTKHLTVTIDAFTIHNNLWQGKKVNLPNKRDMTLVI